MQLSHAKRGTIAAGLATLSANLLSIAPAWAQDTAPAPIAPPSAMASTGPAGLMDEGAPEPGSFVADSSVLFYKEAGSRVQAIEPTFNVQQNLYNGGIITGGVTFDSLTGATPNGATRSNGLQTFTSVIRQKTTSTQVTRTSASGGAVVTTIPGTALAQSSYTTPAYALPLGSFHDHRVAVNGGYSFLADPDTRIKLGGSFSIERDYTAFTEMLGVSRDLNAKNTTLSLTVNLEQDISRPFNGTPAAFQSLNSQITGGNDNKSTYGVLAGLTQTLARFWITQINYSFTTSNGYQADPYRVLSLVDATGTPVDYLYENRPRSRQRQSVYWGNKLALGPTVADASLRYYHDSWGINAITAEVSEQVPINRYLYVKPMARYYHQSAANFFQYYLLNSQTLPQYASSDSRLSRFNATTFGGRIGWRLIEDSELYLEGETYRQTGAHSVAGAPGALAGVDLFTGVKAFSIMTGFRIKL